MSDQEQGNNQEGRSWPDVAITGILAIKDLINNSQIYPLAGLFILSYPLVALIKMDDKDVGPFLTTLFEQFFGNKGLLIAAIILTNIAWLWVHGRIKREMQREINRLAKERSDLIHNTPKQYIEEHRSTSIPEHIKTAHVVPNIEHPTTDKSENPGNKQ